MGFSMNIPQKLKTDLPYDPAVPLPRIDPKKSNSECYKDNCTFRLTVVPIIIVKL